MFVFWFKVWFEWYEQVSMFCVSDQDRMKIIIRQVWKFERKENSKLKHLCIAGYITQRGWNCSVLLFVEENWTSWCICLPNKVNQKEICISSWYHVSVIWVCLISKLAVICLQKEMPYILMWTWGQKNIIHVMYGLTGNSWFVFPRVLMFPETKLRETSGFKGKQN